MSDAESFRWQAFFQHAAQPIFLVNRRRRILFVNRAWEICTGLTLAEVRGRVCRRRSKSASVEREESILSAPAPPAEAMDGDACDVRRRAPQSGNWWEIHFQPLAGPQTLLGILGTIRVLEKPVEVTFSLPEKLMALRDRQARRYRLDDLRPATPAMHRLVEQARLAAQSRLPVTLVGEPGAGKQWLARAIHALSWQRHQYFACLDAERVPAALLGEIIYGAGSRGIGLGTIYVREPAALPREWQTRLMESVTMREDPDFPRLIVGQRNDPRIEIQAGRLLDEFHCAVSPITIVVPPLRERLDALPQFIELFLQRARDMESHPVQGVGAEALKILAAHAWPENLRELQQVIRDACRRAKSDRIELGDLPFSVKHGPLPPERRLPLDTLLEQVERRLMMLALKLAQNNQTRAAELLEIWRPRLMRRMEKFGIKG